MTLSCGKILSYHKELNICHNADNSVILLGHAWSVLPIEEQAPPSSFVENMNRTLTEEEIIQEWSKQICELTGYENRIKVEEFA